MTSGSIMARSATWHAMHDTTLIFQTSFVSMLIILTQL